MAENSEKFEPTAEEIALLKERRAAAGKVLIEDIKPGMDAAQKQRVLDAIREAWK